MSSWTAASSDCSRPVNNYVHVKTADLYRPNARLTPERQGYQVLTPFGKLGYSQKNLSYSGGVALNSIANESIVHRSRFDDVYITPAAEDSGPAIGAAYYGLWEMGKRYCPSKLTKDSFGRTYSSKDIDAAAERFADVEEIAVADVYDRAVEDLCSGKIVGWFFGGSELGPRALGQRSILCDPRRPDSKERLNSRVKHREGFRPFAPIVLPEFVLDWFDPASSDLSSPFMLRVMRFRKDRAAQVPAVVHEDGTGRVQTLAPDVNQELYELVSRFHRKTGVPILLNTSFNVMGEPLVETPDQALWALLYTDLDACIIEGRYFRKKATFGSMWGYHPALVVKTVSAQFPVRDGRICIHPDSVSHYSAEVSLRWGRLKKNLGKRDMKILASIDGVRTLREVHGHSELTGESETETFLRDVARLYRLSIVDFEELRGSGRGQGEES